MSKTRVRIAASSLRPNGGERGMTLVETLVALAIFGLVAGIFLGGLYISSKSVMVSQESVAAESLAKSELEYIKGCDYDNLDPVPWSYDLPSGHPSWDENHNLPPGYSSYSVQVSGATVPGHESDDDIQKITVQVTHNGDEVFTLVDYKVNR